MDEEQLRALEEDIRIVDEDIRSLKKRTEEIDREIADTSDPERIKTLRQRLDLIDQKQNILLQQKTILLQERANLRGQGHASSAIVELVKRLEQDVRKQFEELRLQLASRRDEALQCDRSAKHFATCSGHYGMIQSTNQRQVHFFVKLTQSQQMSGIMTIVCASNYPLEAGASRVQIKVRCNVPKCQAHDMAEEGVKPHTYQNQSE